VTEALLQVDGVVSAEVSLENASATVTARGPLSLDALTAAVEAAGYTATA